MNSQTRPDIFVTPEDHDELIELALKALGRAPGADLLLEEMKRAKVTDAVPANALGMNGAVEFEYDGRRYRDFHLVYPHCADFADGRISVLTPVGAALIGLMEGDTIWWPDEAREIHRLTALKVNHAPPH